MDNISILESQHKEYEMQLDKRKLRWNGERWIVELEWEVMDVDNIVPKVIIIENIVRGYIL